MMIDEVNASKKSYIRDTPQYVQWGFLGQQDKRFMNRKSDGGHPFSQQPSQTYYEDPLIVGSKEHHKGTFLQYNNRAIESGTKHLGGAMMYQQPQDSDSSDYSSSSDEEEGGALMYQQPKADKYKGGDLSQMTKEELMEMIQGGGIYDDYIKPAGKFLGKVGSEIVNDIIVPVGKELVKDAVRGAVTGAVVGAGKRGRPKGSKNKAKAEIDPPVVEAIHLEHLVAPKAKHSKKVLKNVEDELKRVEKEKEFEKGEIKAEPKKRKSRSKKVLANIEDELKRVEKEKEFEKGEIKAEGGKKKRTMSDKMKHRAELVKKVMKEHGLKLGAASKYVKEHNMA
jgi:hypothetical protein